MGVRIRGSPEEGVARVAGRRKRKLYDVRARLSVGKSNAVSTTYTVITPGQSLRRGRVWAEKPVDFVTV